MDNVAASAGPRASSVNTPSSTALRSVFGPQKPKPSWRIRSGVISKAIDNLLIGKVPEFRPGLDIIGRVVQTIHEVQRHDPFDRGSRRSTMQRRVLLLASCLATV